MSGRLFERASGVIVGGVNSPVRAFGSVGGTPYFVARAQGPHVFTADGDQLIDLVCSYGAIICGHANEAIAEAVSRAAASGTSYGAPTENEVRLAEAIRARAPHVEMMRLVNSGTEATMTAVRVARGHTGRNRIVKFAGNYHGHADALLAAGGSGVATLGLSGSAGVPDAAVAETVVAPYNVVPELDGPDLDGPDLDEQVAAVIVEPVAANMGLVAPEPGWLASVREACDRAGALLIFDEVITGFRLGYGGAAQRYGVVPDLTTFGKVIGGGLPIGVVGGKAEVMEALAPLGPVYQAGTLSGNPLATAAGLAALEQLTPDAYVQLERAATQLAHGWAAAFGSAGVPITVVREGTLVGLYCGDTSALAGDAPRDYDEAKTTDEAAYAELFHKLLANGVALAPGAYEAVFVTTAHTAQVIDEVIERTTRALS